MHRDLIIFYSEDGKTTTLNLDDKWSSTILKELMNIAGGDPWKKYVAESTAAGLPAISGEAFHSEVLKPEVKRKVKDNEVLPSLKEYREKNPRIEKPAVDKSHTPTKPKPKSSSPP
jgi:small subunit ribosomal protein S25